MRKVLEYGTIRYAKHDFPWHLHPRYYSFSLTLGGEATLFFPDKTYTVSAGDIVIIPPLAPHRTIVGDTFHYRIVRLSAGNLDGFSERNNQGVLIRNPEAVVSFNRWFETLYSDRESFPDFIRFFCPELSPKEPRQGHSLLRVLSYIEEHFSDPIQLPDLSRLVHLSDSHFQRLFRHQFGISPMRYLQSLRIDKAKELIKDGNSFTYVAMTTGFYDQSHFNKYFRMWVGLNPKEYQSFVKAPA